MKDAIPYPIALQNGERAHYGVRLDIRPFE